MMEKVRDQNQIVRAPKLHLKGVACQRRVAVGHAELFRVFSCHCKHVGPIESCDSRFRILLSDQNAKQSVSGGDVQYPYLSITCYESCHLSCCWESHRRHLLREIDPDWVVVTDSSLIRQRRSSGTDNLRQIEERSDQAGVKEKTCGTAEVCR